MGVFQNLTDWHAIIILIVIVLLFGATKLPLLAKSVGQSMKIFKGEMKDMKKSDADTAPATAADGVDAFATDAAEGTPAASASPGAK